MINPDGHLHVHLSGKVQKQQFCQHCIGLLFVGCVIYTANAVEPLKAICNWYVDTVGLVPQKDTSNMHVARVGVHRVEALQTWKSQYSRQHDLSFQHLQAAFLFMVLSSEPPCLSFTMFLV